MIQTITRRVTFPAAHHFYNPAWSPEENEAKFGPTANRLGHGHNYEVFVEVTGPVDPETAMVMNLSELKAILKEHVVAQMAFQHLNHQVSWFQHAQPTLDVMVVAVWNVLAPVLADRDIRLVRVQIYEQPDIFAEYFGEVADE